MQDEDKDLKALDQEEAALREDAMKVSPPTAEDATITDDVHTGTQAAGDAEQPAKKTDKPATDKTAADKVAQEAAEKAKADKAKATQQPDPKAEAAKKAKDEAVDESKLTPYEKERRRLDKTWKSVNEEKEAVRKEREALDAERKKIAEERTKVVQPPVKPTHNGFDADQYEQVAKDFEAEGKLDLRDQALAKAKELRAQEEKAKGAAATAEGDYIKLPTGGRVTKQEQAAMGAEWHDNLTKLGKDNPELAEEGKPLRTEVTRLLKEYPILHTTGKGIVYAVDLAKLTLRAAKAEELEKQVTEQAKEITRLTELTSLSPSGGAHRPAAVKVEDMPIDDAEAKLRGEAMSADSRGGG